VNDAIIVAIDLETTGLDAGRDSIIEIGAVKFQGRDVLDEWSTFVNPGRPIPAYVTQLTGIRQEEVDDAPTLSRVLPEFGRFVGNCPVLGHNVRFDLGFLNQYGALLENAAIDTYEITSVLLPTAERYNLGALARELDVRVHTAHRALDDAYLTFSIYAVLWERVMTLPVNTLAEIVQASYRVAWDGAFFFQEAMKVRTGETIQSPQSVGEVDLVDAFQLTEPLRPSAPPEPIDEEKAAGLLEDGGNLARVLPDYEYRPQQVQMLRAVADALNRGDHLMVEAPTGVGKSLAYLLPAVLFAVQNGQRVVVSTNTINLQEQLLNKDIPLLSQILDKPFRAAVLKGRSNYLCPRQLDSLRRRGPTSPIEMRLLGKLLVWRLMSNSGDREKISLRGPAENAIWVQLSAEGGSCFLDQCEARGGDCPFYRARQAAETAHVLIVNHALLLADVRAENRVLPNYDYLVVDEAHHLEDATTHGLSFRTSPDDIVRQMKMLGGTKAGVLGDMLQQCQGVIPSEYLAQLTSYAARIEEASGAMQHHVDFFFNTLRDFLLAHVKLPHSEYRHHVRIVNALRRQPGWMTVEESWEHLRGFMAAIADAMREMANGLATLDDYDIPEYEDLVGVALAAARDLLSTHDTLSELVSQPDANTIYWVAFMPDGEQLSVHTAPLDVSPLLQEHLWFAKESVIVTSATLQTAGTFDFIRARLGAEDVSTLVVDSPFDYEASTLVYIVDDIPEPSSYTQYQRAVEHSLTILCRATEGRTLALFTSYAQLRETTQAVSAALMADGIVVYDQSDGSSRSNLLEGFVKSEKAVLMGTRSFWEGVDVPGEDLSVLAIARLPFNVPTDPIFAARNELFDRPFWEYAVPETILRFRQGFGRLIRRKSDRGVFVIFDRRVLTKQYGRLFLESLPRCTIRQGSMAELPLAAVEWLAVGGDED
jgi:DNA polymerase-3 subunit epsilon/ATP-dependent DNA helicase DinG